MNKQPRIGKGLGRAVRLCLALGTLSVAGLANAASCGSLAALNIPDTRIERAENIAAGPLMLPAEFGPGPGRTIALPAHCKVTGIIRPTYDSEIRFEVWLPEQGWNERFLQVGNGGLAGSIRMGDLADALTAGYAAAGTDNGHRSSNSNASTWAYGHPEKLIDYGSRAVHLTAQTARQIVSAYFAQPPRYRYFAGCSDGGRESLMEAQRYPDDFDGYLVGAPGINIPGGSISLLHAARVLNSLAPAERITPAHVQRLSQAVLEQCDANDGVRDGVLQEPLACSFSPQTLACRGAASAQCLTANQVSAIEALYAGPKDAAGQPLGAGLRPTLGAESTVWMGPLVTPNGGPAPAGAVAGGYLAGVLYGNDRPDISMLDLATLKRDAEAFYVPVISPRDPDLSAARAKGKKILHYQGWSDPVNPPQQSTDYYASVRARLGATDDFYRLFMVPGLAHCGGGTGPVDIGHTGSAKSLAPNDARHDWLQALEAWVERDVAPARLIAGEYAPPGTLKRTRPVCAYPQVARYQGRGDVTQADSYRCVAPEK